MLVNDRDHRSGESRTSTVLSVTPLSAFIHIILIGAGLTLIPGGIRGAAAEETWFNPALLATGTQSADRPDAPVTDLSRFESGQQMPGTYLIDIYINNEFSDTRDVSFVDDGHGGLTPELTLADYKTLGLNPAAVTSLRNVDVTTPLTDLAHFIPAATTVLEFSRQRLNISLPQLVMNRRVSGYVDPALWDEGVSAALLNYTLTGNNTRYRGSSASQGSSSGLYANLRGGLNWGAWRLRNYSSYSQTSGNTSSSDFQVISTYLQRDIKSLKGQLTLGETSTPPDVFDSVEFKGGQLVSDEAMLPDSIRGFAPVIRGVASSSAQVTVRQNGNIIYQTYVSPGAFEITDLNPSSFSGDLDVTIKESDGSERHFTQAYSSLAVMQREGQMKYAITAGELDKNNSQHPRFVQGTLVYGLPHDLTAYGGVLVAQKYTAVSGGVGVSLGDIGAVSADITKAEATLYAGDKSTGQSYRVRYSKSVQATGTTVNMAAYRYSTSGYYGFSDASSQAPSSNERDAKQGHRRSELELSLSQSLGDWGTLYISGSQRDFWGTSGTERTWSAGYNGSSSGISYGLNYSHIQNNGRQNTQKSDNRFAFNVSVPLSRFLPGNDQGYYHHSMQANYGMNTNQNHRTSHYLGVGGTALSDGQLSYNLSQTTENQGGGYGASLNGTYSGSMGTVNMGYNYNQTQQQITYGLSGGLVAHGHGVTLSPPLGDTIAIVRAPGAGGMKVKGQNSLYTDGRGYAVMPYLTPYRRTDISVDPGELSDQVAIENTSVPVIPARGAVVMASYQTKVGYQALITLLHGGIPVPFGAMVSVEKSREEDARTDRNTAIVGDDGQVYLSGLTDKGTLNVQWGQGSDQQCRAKWVLPAGKEEKGRNTAPLVVQSICR